MQLFLIRHAQSTNNATQMVNVNNRVADPPLTDLGHQQAQAVARWLADGYHPERIVDALYEGTPEDDARQFRGAGLTKLYCSPMYRTLQTAQYVAKATGLTPNVWVDIHEHGGIFLAHEDERGIVGYPGKTRSEILAEFPDYILTDHITDEGWWSGAEETIHAAYGRALAVASQLRDEAKQSPDEVIGIVSHGTFLNGLLKALLDTLPGRGHWFGHFNTAVSRIDFDGSERLFVRYLNRVEHLPAELISG